MDMIERTARAIYHRIDGEFERYGSGEIEAVADLVDVSIEGRVNLLAVARAAIEAMREPTEAMLEEGPGEPYMEKHVWARMIDAALKEHERKPE